MPDNLPPKPPNSGPTDPLLESLLAKARPIIAAERGLNPRSRVKIQSIGRKMRMPAAVIDQAIQLLHGAPPIQGKEESAYERAFAKVMRQKIAEIPGNILTTRIEEKAISVGQRKYELSEVQSRNIIRRVADEVGVPRVTLSEAERHMEQEIADVVGDETYITGNKKQSLIKNGLRLGVTDDQVQSMIKRHLQFNFQQVQNEQKLTDRLWIVAACIVVGTGLALFVFFQMQKAKQEEQAIADQNKKQEVAKKVVDPSRKPAESPEWWTDTLKVLLQKTRLKVKGFAELHDRIKSPAASKRSAAYREFFFLDRNQINPIAVRGRIGLVIPTLFQLEPNPEAYVGILEGIESSCTIPTGKLPVSVDFFEKAYWALGLANECLESDELDDQKLDAIQYRIRSISGRQFDLFLSSEPRLEKIKRAVSEKYFNQLIDLGPSFPESAPFLYGKFENLVGDQFDGDRVQDFRYRFLVGFLRFEAEKWDRSAAILETAIDQSTISQLSFFVDLLETTKVEALQFFLQERLNRRAGLGGEITSVDESVKKLREHFALEGDDDRPPETPNSERIDQLVTLFANRCRLHPTRLEKPRLAEVWAQASFLATLIAIGNSADPELVEQLLDAGLPDLDSPDYVDKLIGQSAIGELNEGDSEIPTPGSEIDRFSKQELKRAITQLNQFRLLTPQKRISWITVVGKIAPEIRRLSGNEATILARYLISRKSPDEWAAVLAVVPELRHFHQLAIAIADQLLLDSFNRDTTLDIASLLLNEDLAYEGDQWQIQLGQKLYHHALTELDSEKQARSKPNDPVLNLKSILGFLMQLRARAHGVSTAGIAADDLDGILAAMATEMKDSLREQKKDEPLQRFRQEEKIAESLGNDLLTRIAFKQNLILIFLEAESSSWEASNPKSDALLKIEELIREKSGNYPTIVGQLIENEFRMMQLYYRSIRP